MQDSAAKKLAIIMPAYNAGKTIESVFDRIPTQLAPRITKYVVVNDGSMDDTAAALGRLQQRFANLVVLNHKINKGYGVAEKTLLKFALSTDAEVIILLHADGQYAPEEIPRLIQPFERNQADIAQGSRILGGGALRGGMPVYKYLANRFLTRIENRTFGMKMAEYHSGYMLYSKKAIQQIPFDRLSEHFIFDQEMLVMAKIKGLKIVELPIPTHYGDEISHLRPIRYGLNVLSFIRSYRHGFYHSI
jgi:glycosyltransferase involved in cell wall biosynthesis